MTQTQTPQKSSAPLGVLAATAATTSTQTAGTSAPLVPSASSSTPEILADKEESGAAEETAQATRASRKVYIVVGEFHEFESASAAEKFLNGEGAPKNYAVLRGSRIGTSQKIHLR
jgi:hypothetical protein